MEKIKAVIMFIINYFKIGINFIKSLFNSVYKTSSIVVFGLFMKELLFSGLPINDIINMTVYVFLLVLLMKNIDK